MQAEVIFCEFTGIKYSGVLTTEHAASSYGQPILLVDGQPYGPGDLPGTVMIPAGTDPTIVHAAKRAGWRVRLQRARREPKIVRMDAYDEQCLARIMAYLGIGNASEAIRQAIRRWAEEIEEKEKAGS